MVSCVKTQKRVLYAEDEYTNRKLMEYKLKREGIECDLAADGVDALKIFEKAHVGTNIPSTYGLVILDQYMPGLNGDELARKIRKIDEKVPLVAITSDESQITVLEEAGIDKVLIKPLRGVDYIGVIKGFLER